MSNVFFNLKERAIIKEALITLQGLKTSSEAWNNNIRVLEVQREMALIEKVLKKL